jgi:hypothetical protein
MARLWKSQTFSVSVECPAEQASAFAGNPANLPRWATSFVRSIHNADAAWIAETSEGPVEIQFAPENPFGVLDHTVRPASGVEIQVPMRVVRNGPGCEILFTLFQLPGMTDQRFADDAAMVQRDLQTLKRVLESSTTRK